jgi:dienelactone hydrolase
VLLAHGDADQVVPFTHMERLAAAARSTRTGAMAASVETLVIPGGEHSWLYEEPDYRGTVARFLAASLGGPLTPDEAAAIAGATPAERIPDGEARFAAVAATPGGFRTLAEVALPGATRAPSRAAAPSEPGVPPAADEPGLG